MTLIERLRAEDGPYDINPEDDVYGLNRKVLLIREAAAALEALQAVYLDNERTMGIHYSERKKAEAALEEAQRDKERLRKLIPGCYCMNPNQCWESCGTLGHSADHVAIVAALNNSTAEEAKDHVGAIDEENFGLRKNLEEAKRRLLHIATTNSDDYRWYKQQAQQACRSLGIKAELLAFDAAIGEKP